MAENWLSRQRMLVGDEGLARLAGARVALAGLGGVGGATAEALCRAGVGSLTLMDFDKVSESNLNRQLLATRDSLGQSKITAAAERLGSINPDIKLTLLEAALGPDSMDDFLVGPPDFVIDAIDMVSAKLALIMACRERKIPLVSSLGTGNRLEAAFVIGDIFDTAGCGCPLARVMRRELRKLGVEKAEVLYSTLPPLETGSRTPGSISFVPPAAGLLLAGHAVRALLGGGQ